MKLTPKAKPIRIRIVSGGEEHSSIDSLRHNYSLGDILPLVKDGRLYKWLLRIGETKIANSAYKLIHCNTYANSRDMVELTATIFNTNAKNLDDLIKLWERKYPRSFFNYIKAYGGSFPNISSARQSYELYERFSDNITVITSEEWQNIFVTTLKRMPLLAVLEDFKKFKSVKPMHVMAWLKVLSYHAESASDKELYLIAQAAYEYPGLKDEAVEWYLKSAKTYIKAKEWVNKNIKRLDPKEQKLFDTFESNPPKFNEYFFDSSYPQDLVRFLASLSSIYRTNSRPYLEQITGRGNYSKYLFIVDCLYDNSRWDRLKCIQRLKQLPNNINSAYYFGKYKTLDKIILSLERNEPIFGVELVRLNYRQAILFIAGLAKTELENEK